MKRKFLNRKTILLGSIALVTVLLAVGAFAFFSTMDKITNNPLKLFGPGSIITDAPSDMMTSQPEPTDTQPGGPSDGPTLKPGPTPTPDPYDVLKQQADTTVLNGTVNVLLIGVDWSAERENNPKQYVGKYFNSDVMMLLAMHFSNGKLDKCDMLSFPRDSFAPIHGMPGIYKMNFALSAGGGMNNEGFMNVCNTVEDQLGGGIPVDYYISVTMPAVKDLANAIGGVDYNVDVEFTIDGRHYKKGMQHMDGQGVLDYCRVRKGELSSGFGDLNRVNRQKNMLLAVFKKLQSSMKLADVPRIVLSVKDCNTNLSLPQLALFAYCAKDIDASKNVTMNTMPGSYAYGIYNKNYVLINQAKRVELIKKIFNKTVEPMYKYDAAYAKLQWAYMQGEAWTDAISHVLITDAALKDPVTALPAPKIIDPDLTALRQVISDTNKLLVKYKSRLNASKPVIKSSEYTELQNKVKLLQSTAKTIFAKTGYSKVNWYVNVPEVMKMKE